MRSLGRLLKHGSPTQWKTNPHLLLKTLYSQAILKTLLKQRTNRLGWKMGSKDFNTQHYPGYRPYVPLDYSCVQALHSWPVATGAKCLNPCLFVDLLGMALSHYQTARTRRSLCRAGRKHDGLVAGYLWNLDFPDSEVGLAGFSSWLRVLAGLCLPQGTATVHRIHAIYIRTYKTHTPAFQLLP